MRHDRRYGVRRLAAPLLICAAAAIVYSLPVMAQPKPDPAGAIGPAHAAAQADPSEPLYRLGFKFNSAATCANATCHGGPDRQRDKEQAGLVRDNSYTLWNQDATAEQAADPHRTSWRKLKGQEAGGIGRKMGIVSPATDAKCLSCHALNPPAALLGGPTPLYNDGVTCDACHGPSGESTTLAKTDPASAGRLALHLQRGWIKSQRAAFDKKPQELLKKFGFYDNHFLVARAQRCTSCHLAIDPKMVAAGHPQPSFELNWYSLTYDNRHWEDPADNGFGARLWAAGQVVALEDALRQLADRAAAGDGDADVAGAYEQAMAHYTVFKPLLSTGAVNGNPGGVSEPFAAARGLLSAAGKRSELAVAARTASDAAGKLAPAVEAFVPTQASTTQLLAAILTEATQATPADGVTAFAIDQQRDAVFALYDAYAARAGPEKSKDDENKKWIGEKLFPTDAAGRLVPAKDMDKAKFKSALAEVKARLRL